MTFSGSAILGGTLAAHLNGSYEPNTGDSFTVLNYGNNALSFTNLALPLSNDWQTNSTNGTLVITATAILPHGVAVSPTNSLVPVGATVTLVASATGPGPFTY